MTKVHFYFFIFSIALVSCTKDNVTEPSTETSNFLKDKSFNNKSDADLVAELESFITTIINNNDSITEGEAEEVLLYTESTLNYRLVNEYKLPSESKVFNFEIEVLVEEGNNGYLVINPSNILAINKNIYDVIYDSATTYVFENASLPKFVSVVDLKWGSLSLGYNTVYVEYVINNNSFSSFSCQFSDSWYPIFDDGGCNGNTATSSDAAQEINRRANKKACNQHIYTNPYGNGIALWHHIQASPPFGSRGYNGSNYTTNSIWSEYSRYICIQSTELNELTDSCIWISSNERPPDYYLKNVVVYPDLLVSQQYSAYWHVYKYYYGDFLESTLQSVDPMFL